MVWFDALRKHPIYKTIKKTATSLIDLDDYSSDEAWKSAIGQRKFLFDTILEEYYPPEMESDDDETEREVGQEDDSNNDPEEPAEKKHRRPLTGYLTARFGCRYVAVAGSLLAFLGYGVSLFVSNLYVLYITMGFITGSGFGLLYLPAMVAVTLTFDKYRTLAMGLSLCGAGIGAFVFSPLQKILLDEYSWQGTILINAGIILNCAPFALLLTGNQPNATKTRDTVGFREDGNKETAKEVELKLLNNSEVYDKNRNTDKNHSSKLGLEEDLRDYKYIHTETSDVHMSEERTILMPNYDLLTQACSQNVRATVDVSEGSKDMEIIIEAEKVTSTKKATVKDSLGILKEPLFLLFTTSQWLFLFGLYLPFIYIPARSKHIGIEEKSTVWVVSTIGIASIFSRIVLGYAVDRVSISRAKFTSFTLLIGGISTALVSVSTSLWSMFVYAAVFGTSIGVSISFVTVVLADLIGIDKINEAFGMNNLFSGIAVLLGPPFAGVLFDMTGDYNATFIVSGVTQALAGFLMFFTPLLKKR